MESDAEMMKGATSQANQRDLMRGRVGIWGMVGRLAPEAAGLEASATEWIPLPEGLAKMAIHGT